MGILKQLFGPSRNEIWSQLCKEIEADLVDGGFWRGKKVVAKAKEWTITLDTYTVSNGKTSVTYTRMRAPFVNKDNFRFKIYRSGLFSKIGKFFGMQDVEVGFPEFDEEFIIKGNDTEKIKRLFSNPKIRELISKQPNIYLEVRDDEGWFGAEFPDGVDELYFQVPGVIRDVERLKNLYYLFAEVLNQLCLIGSAYQKDPGVNL